MLKFKQFLLEATKQQFFDLANQQRDLPEKAMLKVQFAMHGGVMSSACEHVGDLIHRMSEKATFGTAGYEFVKEKVVNMLHLLKHPYGFGKEFLENLENNAAYLKVDLEEFKNKVYAAMEEYAKEHEKLPTYNHAQELAKMAAVSLGKRNFRLTISCLEELMSHLGSRDEWIKFAHEGLDE